MLLNARLNTHLDIFGWQDVNWHVVEENVRKLQCRIAKAEKMQNPGMNYADSHVIVA